MISFLNLVRLSRFYFGRLMHINIIFFFTCTFTVLYIKIIIKSTNDETLTILTIACMHYFLQPTRHYRVRRLWYNLFSKTHTSVLLFTAALHIFITYRVYHYETRHSIIVYHAMCI